MERRGTDIGAPHRPLAAPEAAVPEASAGTAAGPQAGSAVIPREVPPDLPTVLDGAQRALLTAVLDRLVPAHDDLPGAGALGVTGAIDRTLAASPALRRLFFEGLLAIELASAGGQAGGTPRAFVDLAPGDQDALLQAIERALPAFFAALVDHCYRGYYTLPPVHRAIGCEGRPPQPLGHRLRPFDPALLDRQRRRAPFWRRAT